MVPESGEPSTAVGRPGNMGPWQLCNSFPKLRPEAKMEKGRHRGKEEEVLRRCELRISRVRGLEFGKV